MTLQEAETELSQIDAKITELIKQREYVLKEWHRAFNTENQENMECIDESEEDYHKLYLVNGSSKMEMCRFSSWELKHSVEEFYRMVDNKIRMIGVANGRECALPENQSRLLYAKIAEIREQWETEMGDHCPGGIHGSRGI